MLQYLEQQTKLTGNQRRIIAAAVLGDMLEFFDYFLIGYVVAFIAGPWKLTFGESAVILLSSGFGAMFGAVFYGWLADKIGRRKVFLMTVINFSVATGILTFTPDNAWIFLSVFRFLIGFGVGGLYCVDLPLVQEFVPASKRGMVGGLVTAAVPIGVLMGAALGAFATPYVGWRGLFAIGMVPGLLTLLIRAWVPESPRWLIQMGRIEEAQEIAGLGPRNGPGSPPNGCGRAGGAEAAHVPALGHLPVPKEPGGLLDHESRRADGVLRAYSVGSDLVGPAIGRHARAGILPADLCQFCRSVWARRDCPIYRTRLAGRGPAPSPVLGPRS